MVEFSSLGVPALWRYSGTVELVQDAQGAITVGAREEAGEGEAIIGGSTCVALSVFLRGQREGRCWYWCVLVFVGCV